MGKILGFPYNLTIRQEGIDKEVLDRLNFIEPEIREEFAKFVEKISTSMGTFNFEFDLAEHPHQALIQSVCEQICSGYTVQISWILKMLVDYKLEDLRQEKGL